MHTPSPVQERTVAPARVRQVACRSLAALCVVAALALALVDVGSLALVVDGELQPTSRLVAGLLAGATAFLVLDAVLPVRDAEAPGTPVTGRRTSGRLGVLAGIGALIALAVPSLDALTFTIGSGAHSTTLTPAGPDGCVLIARESVHSPYWASGTLYAWRPGDLLATAVGDYGAGSGYTPFREGDYRVTWDGDVAQVRLASDLVSDVTVDRAACS